MSLTEVSALPHPKKISREDLRRHLIGLAESIEEQGDKQMGDSLAAYSAMVGLGRLQPQQWEGLCELQPTPEDEKILADIHSIDWMAEQYREFVAASDLVRFSISSWLPSLKQRPIVPGELVAVIGDTGTAKTAFVQNLIQRAAPLTCLMFQLELPTSLLFERYMSMETGIDGEDLYKSVKSDPEVPFQTTRFKHVWTCTKSRLSPEQIEERIQKASMKIGSEPVIVVVDYVGLVAGKGERYNRVSDAVEFFKTTAKNLNVIMVVVAQISRPPDRELGEPKLHSAKDSGSIESSAGLHLGLSRDANDPGLLRVKVLKSTKGGAGNVAECRFEFPSMKIFETTETKPGWASSEPRQPFKEGDEN
jgi:KaiC/GvpD/RAD55 family RecA-like ATPase